MKSIVLSDEPQYRAWKALPSAEWKIYCDNAQFAQYLRREKVPFEMLDDFLIRSEWETINSWSCSKAADFIRYANDRKAFSQVDMASCLFFNFAYILVAIVTNRRFAQYILKASGSSEICVFVGQQRPPYPSVNGNIFLNEWLKILASQEKRALRQIKCPQPAKSAPDFKTPVKRWVTRLLAPFVSGAGRVDVLASGSMTHLTGVLAGLQAKNISLALYSAEYDFHQLRFCMKNRIPYWTSTLFKKGKGDAENAQKIKEELIRIFTQACAEGFFTFKGEDLGSYLADYLKDALHGRLSVWAQRFEMYGRMIEQHDVKSILLDEDFSGKNAFMAAYFKSRNKKSFCVSHAHYPVSFTVPEKSRLFAQSVTYVNSEYEKKLYEERGWRAGDIKVTGTPRFDRLSSYKENPSQPSGKLKLFFCGSSLWFTHPKFHYYLGTHITNYAEVQIPCLEMLFEASKDLPVEIIAKPHMKEDEAEWREYFEKAPTGVSRQARNQTDNFHAILNECDVLVLGYWSTAVVEAAHCKKPVVILDPFDLMDARTPFVSRGHCPMFAGAAALRLHLEDLIRRKNKGEVLAPKFESEEFQYYYGPRDGKNSARVVEAIVEDLVSAKGKGR